MFLRGISVQGHLKGDERETFLDKNTPAVTICRCNCDCAAVDCDALANASIKWVAEGELRSRTEQSVQTFMSKLYP